VSASGSGRTGVAVSAMEFSLRKNRVFDVGPLVWSRPVGRLVSRRREEILHAAGFD
jgi:hypothetical protein